LDFRPSAFALLTSLLILGGCADSMRSTLSPEFQGKTVSVDRIGVAGPGASLATQEFIKQGYTTIDLATPGSSGVEVARTQGVPFVATVDAVDTSQSVWDGLYSFAMRVSDTRTGAVVWSSSGTFGQGGMSINLQESTKNAMKAMISDFAKTFPPTGK
jgi:hypothetical protein